MSKKLAVIAAATGVTGLTVGGMMLLSNSSSTEIFPEEKNDVDENAATPSDSPPIELVKQVNRGMQDNEEISFIKDYGIKGSNRDESGDRLYFDTQHAKFNMEDFDLTDSEPLTNSREVKQFLGTYDVGDYKLTKSSLRITSKKQQYANGRGKGSLSWFWSFMHENKGFITFNVASTSEGGQMALDLVGGFYLVEKKGDKWKIKYHKEVDSKAKKLLTPNLFGSYFPKPNWYTKQGEFDKVYQSGGNFMSNMWDMYDICLPNECKDNPKMTNSVGAWEGSGDDWYDGYCDSGFYSGGCDKVYAWSSDEKYVTDLQWWDYMYSNHEFNLKKYLSSFYRGAWKRLY